MERDENRAPPPTR